MRTPAIFLATLLMLTGVACNRTHVQKLARIAPDATEPVFVSAPENAGYVLAFRGSEGDDIELRRDVTVIADRGQMLGFVPDEAGLQGHAAGKTFAIPRPPEDTRYVAWYYEDRRRDGDKFAIGTAVFATELLFGVLGADDDKDRCPRYNSKRCRCP